MGVWKDVFVDVCPRGYAWLCECVYMRRYAWLCASEGMHVCLQTRVRKGTHGSMSMCVGGYLWFCAHTRVHMVVSKHVRQGMHGCV